MPGALYLLLSGPADAVRALELLRLAESQAGSGDHGVAVLLQGDAVAWLAGSDGDEAADAVLAEAQAALQVDSHLFLFTGRAVDLHQITKGLHQAVAVDHGVSRGC